MQVRDIMSIHKHLQLLKELNECGPSREPILIPHIDFCFLLLSFQVAGSIYTFSFVRLYGSSDYVISPCWPRGQGSRFLVLPPTPTSTIQN